MFNKTGKFNWGGDKVHMRCVGMYVVDDGIIGTVRDIMERAWRDRVVNWNNMDIITWFGYQ